MKEIKITKKMYVLGVVAMIVVGLILSIKPFIASAAIVPEGRFVGNIINTSDEVWNNTTYKDKLKLYAQEITAEDSAKWSTVETTPGVYNWTHLDRELQFAEDNNLPFKAHGLLWGPTIPSYVASLPTVSERRAAAANYITAFMTRYQGRIWSYELINEPIAQPLDSLFGLDYISYFYQLGRSLDPAAKLFINEYDIENNGGKADSYYALANELQAQGLLDGIGMQGHFIEGANLITIAQTIEHFSALALPIYITELDIVSSNDTAQYNKTKELLELFESRPQIRGITFWGFWAGAMWQGPGALLRQDFSERPAGTWLRETFMPRFAADTTQMPQNTITIRAKGTPAGGIYPTMQVMLGNSILKTWSVTDTYVDYVLPTTTSLDLQKVKINFSNDSYNPPEDRNLIVDYIKINDVIYQTEDPSVYSTGSWDGSCYGGYHQSETLNCGGYFEFPTLEAPVSPSPTASETPPTPTPSPSATPTPSVTPSSTPTPIPNGLVAHWNFDETDGTTVADSSGNDVNAEAINNPEWSVGKYNNGLHFDGNNDSVVAPNASVLQNLNSFSVAFWIKTNGLNGNDQSGLVDKNSWQQTGFSILDNGQWGPDVICRTMTPGNFYDISFSRSLINDNNWHHIACTYDASTSTKKLYLDGELKSSATQGYSPDSIHQVFLGQFHGSSNGGSIDDIQIYNQSMTQSEVINVMNNVVSMPNPTVSLTPTPSPSATPTPSVTPTPNTPVLNWNFDEATGVEANDNSGNENIGTLVNGPSWSVGKYNNGLHFDGADDLIEAPNSDSLASLNNFSAMFWIKTNALNSNAQTGLLDKSQWVTSGFSILDNGEWGANIICRTMTSGNFYDISFSRSLINDNAWHHVACTYDAATHKKRLYLDGVLQASANDLYTVNTTQKVSGGIFRGNANGGTMDDIRIYNQALSSTELQTIIAN